MKPFSTWIRKRRWLLLCCGGVLLAFLSCCAFLRISNLSDILAYIGMAKTNDPVMNDFALRRFSAGDSMTDLYLRFPKKEPLLLGHYSIWNDHFWGDATNRTSIEIIAKDDKLIYAVADGLVNGVAWGFTFFQTTNDAEMFRQVDREIDQYLAPHLRQPSANAAKDKKP